MLFLESSLKVKLPICQGLVHVPPTASPSQKVQPQQSGQCKTVEIMSDASFQTALGNLSWAWGRPHFLEPLNSSVRFPLKEGLMCLENKTIEIREPSLTPTCERAEKGASSVML